MGIEYHNNTSKVNDEIQARINKALDEVGGIIKAAAKENVTSKGTGHLRDSIAKQTIGTGDKTVVQIGSPLDYAVYQEFGTGEFAENGAGRKGGWVYRAPNGKFYHTDGSKPKKFLRKAFRDNKQTVIDHLKQELGGIG